MEFKEWLLNDKSYEADWCRKKLIYTAFHRTRMFAFEAAQLAFEAGVKEGMKQAKNKNTRKK